MTSYRVPRTLSTDHTIETGMAYRSTRKHDSWEALQAVARRRGALGSVIAGAPSALASAIASAEGFGPTNNIPTIANNPGDLELGNIGYGTTAAAGGNAITNFGTLADGWAALQNQINLIASGQSRRVTPRPCRLPR